MENNITPEKLMELFESGTITEEAFALGLETLASRNKRNEEIKQKDWYKEGMSQEQIDFNIKRDSLIKENRERAQQARDNVALAEQNYREQYYTSNDEEYLRGLTNKYGARAYTDDDLAEMSFYEIQGLASEIREGLNNKKTDEEIKKAEEPKENFDVADILNGFQDDENSEQIEKTEKINDISQQSEDDVVSNDEPNLEPLPEIVNDEADNKEPYLELGEKKGKQIISKFKNKVLSGKALANIWSKCKNPVVIAGAVGVVAIALTVLSSGVIAALPSAAAFGYAGYTAKKSGLLK